jgi:hypothetical protein
VGARRSQAIAEFALLLPVLMLMLLGAVDVGFLFGDKFHQDRQTAVIAEWAADHPGESWNSVSSHELPTCDVTVTRPSRDLVEATAMCQHHSIFLPILSVPISSRESSTSAPSPSASPEPSPVGS